jgi:hypothetical protein
MQEMFDKQGSGGIKSAKSEPMAQYLLMIFDDI